MNRFLALFAAAITLSSCASILERSTQEVTFVTPGTHDSVCIIDNGDTKYRVWPPQVVTLSKRSADLIVTCRAEGNREKTLVIDPDTQDIAVANMFNGFLPGMFIDHESGALYAYPPMIVVDFTDMPPQQAERPNYDQFLAENPEMFGMEEFRPGDAALMSDKYKTGTPLKKREFPGSGGILDDAAMSNETEGESAPPAPAPAEGAVTGGGGASATPADPATDLISDLTRQMNPHVFGSETGSRQNSFIGGTEGGASDEPVSIQPDEIK